MMRRCRREIALVALGSAVLCGPGGHGQTAAPGQPFRLSENHRYLVDNKNSAVLMQADAAWSAIANLTREEATQYFQDRRAKGFNAVLVNLSSTSSLRVLLAMSMATLRSLTCPTGASQTRSTSNMPTG
jgi:hypothetical protein